MSTRDGFLLVRAGVHQRGELVEGEDDVCAEAMLDADGHFGREPVFGSVQVTAEGDTVVVDFGQSLLAGCDDVVSGDLRGVHDERGSPQWRDPSDDRRGRG